ncbi:Rho GTPase activation protein [Radiomyces spectabilis]|uniref:Rho GTPase activation protein n=1 Tax=Radiomyces spectabilis TaxID=64574 RepID=UPI0022209E8D|nr:Rho GTPase activation protein [Radiomyces spectabilis]KAI8388233.1 Rho GTPase activation protein [Radiomyces spectabilis]
MVISYTQNLEKGVFGLPLSESIRYAHSSISYIDDITGIQCFGVIPTVVAKCGSFLKEEGLTVEGIFRLSGSAKRIGMLQTIFDTPDHYGMQLDWRGYTVHDAANVMRRFLNHLPEPVITLEYYRAFKNTMEFETLEDKIAAFQSLIERLPLAHQYLLLYLLDMLGLFARTWESTRMDIACLASVFAPGMLSHPDDILNPAGYKESQRVLTFLIENQARFSMPRTMYATGPECYSVTGFPSFFNEPNTSVDTLATVPSSSLRRSKTTPTKRHKYGEHEPPQVIYVNRTSSTGGK